MTCCNGRHSRPAVWRPSGSALLFETAQRVRARCKTKMWVCPKSRRGGVGGKLFPFCCFLSLSTCHGAFYFPFKISFLHAQGHLQGEHRPSWSYPGPVHVLARPPQGGGGQPEQGAVAEDWAARNQWRARPRVSGDSNPSFCVAVLPDFLYKAQTQRPQYSHHFGWE